jgi:ACR3 family arsenite efflux pump ArsB
VRQERSRDNRPVHRVTLERQQVWIYLGAIALGLGAGGAWPALAPWLDALLWPTLMLLLFATFVQVPLLHVREAFGDRRFVAAVLIGNFVLLPLVAWSLLPWLPADPVLIVGVLLVLLVPCTDWFITFSQLGGGNVPRAIAVTPLNLLLQLVLLPPWLWIIAGTDGLPQLEAGDFAPALVVVVVPLVLAAVAERWIEARPERDAVRERLAWWPVPLLAVVVFQIAAAQVGAVLGASRLIGAVVPVFVVFLLAAAVLAKLLAHGMVLPHDQGRTLAFSLGTRNSFIVLPFALSLPPGWELAAVVIVVQSLVELLGMVLFLWWIPRRLFPG